MPLSPARDWWRRPGGGGLAREPRAVGAESDATGRRRSPARDWWRRPAGGGLAREPHAVAAEPSAAPGGAAPFWLLMTFTGILLIAPQTFLPGLASLRIALLTMAAAVVACLVQWLGHGQPLLRPTREGWVTAGLAGWALFTLPLSLWPGGSLGVFGEHYVKALMVFWLLGQAVTSSKQLHQLAWGLTLMAVPLGSSAVRHFVTGETAASRILGYEGSLLGNPNDLALALNLVLPLTVALLLLTRRPIVRAALVGMIALDATAVILTFSRAGFLTLATIGLVYQWKLRYRPERVWGLFLLLVAVAVLPLLPAGYLGHLSTVTNISADPTGSAEERWEGMVAAVRLALDHPLMGAGVGMNILALNGAGGPAWREVHNVYLEYAVDLGLPGLALFVLLLAWSIGSAGFARRQAAPGATGSRLGALAEGIQVSLVAFAVAGFFYPVAYHFFFYYFAGLAVAARSVAQAEGSVGAIERQAARV